MYWVFFQVKLLLSLGKQSIATITKATSFLGDLSKSMQSEKAEKKPDYSSQAYQYPPAGNHGDQTYSVASVTENDLPNTLTTSGDLASLDMSPTKELEIAESSQEGVKLSLWLQWTLPKCEFRFYLDCKQG